MHTRKEGLNTPLNARENIMRTIALSISIFALAACGNSGSDAANAPQQVAKGPCSDVEMILAAKQDNEPFASLRGNNQMMGDMVLDDKWVAKTNAFDGACEVNAMRGFFGEPMDIHTFKCTLFEAGNFDRKENEVKARAAMAKVEATLSQCLGDDWIVEETTEKRDFDIYRKLKYSPVIPVETGSDFTVDALYAELSFTPFMRGRGGKSGWDVIVQFQEQVDTSPKD
jgi:hypothetical protein